MTRPFFAIAVLAAACAPAAAAERRYSVTDFERVHVEGPYIVRLSVGRSTTAVASGTPAALDRASVDVSGTTLRIRRNRAYWGGNTGAQEGPVTIELTTRTLRSVRLVGPARFEVAGAEGLRVDLIVEGSGQLRATGIRADTLSLGLAGAGRLEVAGTTETLNADIQGTGELDASELRAENATLSSMTTGNVTASVSETATVTALGLGEVTILGRPDCNLRGPNASLVRCGSDQRQQR